MQRFALAHAPCGTVAIVAPDDPTEPAHLLAAVCQGCGGRFDRWITADLLRFDLLASVPLSPCN
jgi:hypothetical protein